MEKKVIYLYVLETMADWEPGYAIAELNSGRYFKKSASEYIVKTVGANKNTITTLGGMKIIPDVTITEVDPGSVALLILPGGDLWDKPEHSTVLELTEILLNKGVLVAAICGATVALANAGILDNFKHTSNNKDYLIQTCKHYKGSENFSDKPAVTDRNLITASGLASLEFAYEILKNLDVFEAEALESWYNLYSTKKAQYFFELMDSVS